MQTKSPVARIAVYVAAALAISVLLIFAAHLTMCETTSLVVAMRSRPSLRLV